MKNRFFSKGKDVKLFMLSIDEENKEIYEYVLRDRKWTETTDLMKLMMVGLFREIEEIEEDQASSIYSDKGFEEAMNNIPHKKKK